MHRINIYLQEEGQFMHCSIKQSLITLLHSLYKLQFYKYKKFNYCQKTVEGNATKFCS